MQAAGWLVGWSINFQHTLRYIALIYFEKYNLTDVIFNSIVQT